MYDSTLATDADKVRLIIGDTDNDHLLLSDEVIDWLLTRNSDIDLAAADACEMVAASLARDFKQMALDGESVTDEAYDRYMSLAKELRRKVGRRCAMPFAGGVSRADKTSREQDTDRVQPSFTRSLHNGSVEGAGSLTAVLDSEGI